MMKTTTASTRVRRARARLHNHVLSGGSLTMLLHEGREPLEGVELHRLVRWIPNVGPVKAGRILRGLPHYYKLGELNADKRDVLVQRIADIERHNFTRLLTTHHDPYQEA